MPLSVRNLDYLKSRDIRLYEAITDLIGGIGTVEQQVSGNANGNPKAPPAVNGVQVTGANGYLHVAVTDNNQIYRGIKYYAEHADNPQFTNPQVVPMGDSRNITIPVGNQTRYVRVYSAYPFSPPSAPVYHGGAQPISVNGGGSDSGPQFLHSQGSGTGAVGQGLAGPGITAFRSPTGKPPVR